MSLRLINAHEVNRLLPMSVCIDLMRKAMTYPGPGGAVQPIRTALKVPGGHNLLGMMPGFIPGAADGAGAKLGIKVVTVFPGNFGTELGSHQGMVLMFDTVTGRPVGIVEAREITAIRTAAASAVATDTLARPDASVMAVFGYGEQATVHIEALLKVRAFKTVLVWGRDSARVEAFCTASRARFGVAVEAAATVEAAIARADVLCTTTAAPEPFVMGRWLREGQHLNVVGSSIPTTAEVDSEAVRRSRFYVDFLDSALVLAGEFRRARDAGVVTDAHILGSIGDVLTGRATGRRDAKDITLFKSLGMVCEDLVSTQFVLDEAERLGVGRVVEF
jgi:ornithine cyclodeaminase/alanine dehydrogenase-like protein (mu-crystallin family)